MASPSSVLKFPITRAVEAMNSCRHSRGAEPGLKAICSIAEAGAKHPFKKYEIQKPSTFHATLFHCKFSSMFPVLHLA